MTQRRAEMKKKGLLNDLELASLNNYAVFITELEDVNAAEKIIKIDDNTAGSLFYRINFFPHKIEDFERIALIIAPRKLERYR